MASIGRFALAAASATQETTLALASLNFDFSLVKIEAPVAYSRFGSAVSTKRNREAENGSTHVTARKLGALFADDVPQIPNLSHIYGLRVSEIAENPKLTLEAVLPMDCLLAISVPMEHRSGRQLHLVEEQWLSIY